MWTDFDQALGAYERGEYSVAETICAALVSQDPSDAEASNLLGITASALGDQLRAVECFRRAYALRPQRLMYFRNLYRGLLGSRQFVVAEAEVRSALTRFPAEHHAELHSMLLTIMGLSNRIDEAIGLVKTHLVDNPADLPKRFLLSELYRRNGNYGASIAELKVLLRRDPHFVDALNNLAGLQMMRGEFLDAMKSVQSLLKIEPRSAKGNCNLASLLAAAGDVDSAIIAYRNAILVEPSLAKARFQLANLLIQNGDLDEADRLLAELGDAGSNMQAVICARARIHERRGQIQLAFDLIESLPVSDVQPVGVGVLRAVLLEQLGRVDEAVRVLEPFLADSNGSQGVEGAEVHFAMGPMLESLGRYDEAFDQIRLGNEIRRKAFVTMNVGAIAEVNGRTALQQLFSPQIMERCPTSSLSSELPIFIIGMPRSGTTLTEQILGRHPEVHAAGELPDFRQIMRDTHLEGRSSCLLTIIDSESYESRELLVPKNWETISSQELTTLGERYLRGLRSRNATARRITDKMPYNFFVVPLIRRILPNARIIHCQRHPLDTCISCYFQNFNAGSQFSFDLWELGRFYRDYYELLKLWRNEHNISIFDLNYEQLVQNPEQVVPELLEFCGLAWDEECLSSHKSKRVINTASYQQVRRPIYTTSSGRWKNYLSHLAPLINGMGLDAELLTSQGEVRFLPLEMPSTD